MMTEVIQLFQGEKGQASLLVTLDQSEIRVVHASKGWLLMKGEVKEGFWDGLISYLESHLERMPVEDDDDT